MQSLKKIFDFYIFCNIHVALASFSLTKISLLYWQNKDNTIPFFVFFATILSYNYIRLTRIEHIKIWLYEWIKNQKVGILVVSLISFIGCFYILFSIQLNAIIILIPFAFLTTLYVLPPIISKKINLRNLPTIKIFLIAFSWAGITVLFPLIQNGIYSDKVLWLFLQRFLFVIALTLPFDIRDVRYDSETLKTLPIWLGIKNAKLLGLVFLGLSLVIAFFYIKTNHLWIDLFVAFCLGFLLLKSSTNQHRYYSAFWVEGIPILWLGLYFLFA